MMKKRPAAKNDAAAVSKRAKPRHPASTATLAGTSNIEETNVSILTKPVATWSVEDVALWLNAQGLEELSQRFASQGINGEVMQTLSEKDLKQELGVSSLGDRRRFILRRNQANAAVRPELPVPEAAPVAYKPVESASKEESAPMPPSAPNPKAAQDPPRKTPSRQKPRLGAPLAAAPQADGNCLGGPSFPGLPEGGPSKRQMLACKVLDANDLLAEFGYGGPVRNQAEHTAATEDRDEGVKVRIRKMLDMAFHQNTPEIERAQALRNAQRMMRVHALEEADVRRGEIVKEVGGLFAVRIVSTTKGNRVQLERWMTRLSMAVNIHFDVKFYTSLSKCLYIVFYGGAAAAELAVYAFACAANLMDWMAGARALPKDKKFTFGAKHRGELFSEVLETDPGYVEWAKGIERKNKDGAAECLQRFIEYARAVQEPTAWDRAYKEGMADALLKQAKAGHDQQGADAASKAIVASAQEVQAKVLEHFGISLKLLSGDHLARAHGLRNARGSGSSDAAAVTLGQRQIQRDTPLALGA